MGNNKIWLMSLHFWEVVLLVIVLSYVIKYLMDKARILIFGSKLPGPKAWPIIGNAIPFLFKDAG